MDNKHKISLDTWFHIKIVLITIAVFMVGLVIFEVISYQSYLGKIEAFKNSDDITALQSDIDELAVMGEQSRDAGMCQLDVNSTFTADAASDAVRSEELLASVNQLATENADAVPGYWTLVAATTTQKSTLTDNRTTSNSIDQIRKLSEPDVYAQYCRTITRVFASAAYLNDLSRPEGVAALFVGQRNNFLVNIENSVAQFKSIEKVPASLAEEHGELDSLFTNFSELLRGDTNNIVVFSNIIANNLQQADQIFESISDKTKYIHTLSDELVLLSSAL